MILRRAAGVLCGLLMLSFFAGLFGMAAPAPTEPWHWYDVAFIVPWIVAVLSFVGVTVWFVGWSEP